MDLDEQSIQNKNNIKKDKLETGKNEKEPKDNNRNTKIKNDSQINDKKEGQKGK